MFYKNKKNKHFFDIFTTYIYPQKKHLLHFWALFRCKLPIVCAFDLVCSVPMGADTFQNTCFFLRRSMRSFWYVYRYFPTNTTSCSTNCVLTIYTELFCFPQYFICGFQFQKKSRNFCSI